MFGTTAVFMTELNFLTEALSFFKVNFELYSNAENYTDIKLFNPSSAVDDRARPEERRRNELYRQYYEELQRRYDTDRPVDCSVIVVNKAQKYVRSLFCTRNTGPETCL